MPTHQRFRLDNPHDLQNRRKPSVHLEEEPAIAVREPGPAGHLAPQNDQLMSERGILSLKPALRLEWRGLHGQNKANQRDHLANLARFYHSINPDRVFGTHSLWIPLVLFGANKGCAQGPIIVIGKFGYNSAHPIDLHVHSDRTNGSNDYRYFGTEHGP
jgi:hypothetical protein